MLIVARTAKDHLRRMLQHQEKTEGRPGSAPQPDPQMKMPLIGEVRRAEPASPTRKRSRTKKAVYQPRLRSSYGPRI